MVQRELCQVSEMTMLNARLTAYWVIVAAIEARSNSLDLGLYGILLNICVCNAQLTKWIHRIQFWVRNYKTSCTIMENIYTNTVLIT